MRVQFVAAETRLPQPVWATTVVALWAALIALTLVGSFVTGQAISLCWFREIVGVPCLTCGGTRCTLDLLHGHPLAALAHNPLVAIGDGLFAVWIVTRMGFQRSLRLKCTRTQLRFVAFAVGMAAVANWVYVIWSHSID